MMMRAACLVAFLAAQSATASAQDVRRGPALLPEQSPVMKLAAELGRTSGNAEFCGVDPEDLEFFMIAAEARLAKEAESAILLAGSRIEFNTHAAYGRAKGPDEGCEEFKGRFKSRSRRL